MTTYQIVKNTTESNVIGVKVGEREAKFGTQGAFETQDAAFAHDIQQSSGQDGTKDVIVCPKAELKGNVINIGTKRWRTRKFESSNVWEEVRPGRWKLRKRS
jgi:hypothetical protein